MKQTFLYCATGHSYIQEAIRSCISLRSHMPEAAVYLYTDEDGAKQARDRTFDVIKTLKAPRYNSSDKINAILGCPTDFFVFVDTDTLFLRPVVDIFEILMFYDIAIARAPYRKSPRSYASTSIPDCFTEMNTGLIGIAKSRLVVEALSEWKSIYDTAYYNYTIIGANIQDQPAFRESLWNNKLNIRLYILPEEYNLRVPFPFIIGGNYTPRMLHGRGIYLERAIKLLSDYKKGEPIALDLRSEELFNPTLRGSFKKLIRAQLSKAKRIAKYMWMKH